MGSDYKGRLKKVKENTALMSVLDKLFQQRFGFHKRIVNLKHTRKRRIINLKDRFKRERAALRKDQAIRRKAFVADIDNYIKTLTDSVKKLDDGGNGLVGNKKFYAALRSSWNEKHGVTNVTKDRKYLSMEDDPNIPKMPPRADFDKIVDGADQGEFDSVAKTDSEPDVDGSENIVGEDGGVSQN